MTMNIGKEIAALKRMTVTELRHKHVEAFGEPTGSGHKDYLVKRIAWRLQAQEAGDLSERARQRAETLANDADLRTTAPKVKVDDGQPCITTKSAVAFDHDPRVPLPGSILTRRAGWSTCRCGPARRSGSPATTTARSRSAA